MSSLRQEGDVSQLQPYARRLRPCKSALYCSKACQEKNWTGHEFVCAKWAKEREERLASGNLDIGDRQMISAKSGYRHTLNKKPNSID
ncbi:hypothetical protein ACHAWO_005425 [Cyclotella atomus]|uniref:MYND-type domain-containing protein n=1 Tax=Cyclotella atomus TaxID=382360 RepID=A0ABD3QCX9_9STRA